MTKNDLAKKYPEILTNGGNSFDADKIDARFNKLKRAGVKKITKHDLNFLCDMGKALHSWVIGKDALCGAREQV